MPCLSTSVSFAPLVAPVTSTCSALPRTTSAAPALAGRTAATAIVSRKAARLTRRDPTSLRIIGSTLPGSPDPLVSSGGVGRARCYVAVDGNRSWWGWGTTDAALSDDECRGLAGLLPGLAGEPALVPRIADLRLRAPRIEPPASLADRCSTDPADRAGHTYGKAYRDVIRALRADLPHPPDLVARPRDEQDVVDLLEWASSTRDRGHPVRRRLVGRRRRRVPRRRAPRRVLSLDLGLLDRVLEIDEVSHAARIDAGALGPALEAQLARTG